MQSFTLDKVNVGDTATISGISTECNCRIRLMDIGFSIGSSVIPVWQSFDKSIRAYRVKGTLIGLRCEDAKYINVT